MSGWGPFSVENKNAIVTGGALGIGFGIAKRFVEGGANVLIADVNGEAAQTAATKLANGLGKVAAIPSDVSDPEAGKVAIAKCVELFGSVDILVNNAGIYPAVPVMEMTPDLLHNVLGINLEGLVFMSKAAAEQFVKQGSGGKIVNIASVDSVHPSMVGLAAYDSSKGAVLMFTKNFALEMAPLGVFVNAIAPGSIATEGASKPLLGSGMSAEDMKKMQELFIKKIPLKRMGVPDDIAKAAIFLASSGSDYMTGSLMVVDGGMLLT